MQQETKCQFPCGSFAKVEGRCITLYRKNGDRFMPQHAALLETPSQAREAFASCRTTSAAEFMVDCGHVL
jgi:hypothetical protein